MKITGKTLIGLFCNHCNSHTQKSVKYLRRRLKNKDSNCYCSRKCADAAHSLRMKGTNNPNFEGSYHGKKTSEYTKEELLERAKKCSATRIANGTSRGERNGRWAGGHKTYNCVICNKETDKPPYIQRKIDAGLQSPTCSHECVGALGRRNIVMHATSIEIKMAEELTKRGIEYVEQHILGDKFRLDFLLPAHNIVIECDGDYWHNLSEVVIRDKSKNAYIKACGYSLYRFWEHEINADVSACVDKVLDEINERTNAKIT